MAKPANTVLGAPKNDREEKSSNTNNGILDRQIIAVVDDEQDLLDLYEMMLSPLGEVRKFSNPEKFIQQMKSDPDFRPDVIITDYLMPNMTGDKMIQSVQNPESPIASILLSGYLDKEKSISAVNSGVGNILEKPVVKKDLVLLTKELLLDARNKKIQAEISEVMKKLKEMFLWFRILCLNELDLKTMHQPKVIAADSGPVAEAMSLERELQELEQQLHRLSECKGELSSQLQQLHTQRRTS